MARVKVTNSGDLAYARSGVYVDAGETSEAVEVADAELPLLDSHPNLSYELDDESSEQESTDEDLLHFDGENTGDSSADVVVDDKLEEEYVNRGLSEEQVEDESRDQAEANDGGNVLGHDPAADNEG